MESIQQKDALLNQAFNASKTNINGTYVVTKKVFFQIMKETFPSTSTNYFELYWTVLDDKNLEKIEFEEFKNIYELSKLSISDPVANQNSFAIWFPTFFKSKASILFVKMVSSVYFRHVFDFLIFLNAVFIALNLQKAEIFFICIFSFEIFSKIYALGHRLYFRKKWNVFDFLVVEAALILTFIGIGVKSIGLSSALNFLMVLRVIRIFKIFHSISYFRTVINTVSHILPSFATYGCLLLMVYYFFAIIGMEIFGGKINSTSTSNNCGNPLLNNSTFAHDDYCKNNFNDIFSSFVTLFELMVVNQWHVLTEGHVLVTNESARIFFFAFHCICVIVILNIFSAFVIESFIIEFTAAKMKPDSPLLRRIYKIGLGHSNESYNPDCSKDEKISMEMGENAMNNGENSDSKDLSSKSEDKNNKIQLKFLINKRAVSLQGILERMFEN